MAAKKGSTAVATKKVNAPVAYDDEDVGAGLDELGQEDVAIPFIGILQKMSPILDEYDELKAGQIYNNVTMEGFDSIVVVPVHRDHVYNEWVPRDQGGGLAGVHDIDSPLVAQARDAQAFGVYITEDGNELTETFNVYVILVREDGSEEMCIMPFSSTQVRSYKRWMTKMRSIQVEQPDGRRINPPMFAHRFRVKTIPQSNNKGSWYGYDIRFDGENADEARIDPASALYNTAKGFRALVKDGAVRSAEPTYAGSADNDEF